MIHLQDEDFAKPIFYKPSKDPIEIMKEYLLLKFQQEDWHAVRDAANDLGEMVVQDANRKWLLEKRNTVNPKI